MSRLSKDELWFSAFGILVCVAGVVITLSIIVAASGGTFGGRCSKAGYEGAEFELCIKRLKEGLPVYKENIEKWNKGY